MRMKKNQSFEGSLSLSTLTLILYPRQESNLDLAFRKRSFYPLNYVGIF